jgi:transmembrane sensor
MENFISKVKDGSISTKELVLLLKAFKYKEFPQELEGLFSSFWERSSYINDEIDTDKRWDALLTKIDGVDDSRTVSSIQRTNSKFGVKVLLKYAAIFILAFGLSWLLHSLFIKGPVTIPDQYTKIEVSNGSKSKIELPDGTRVNLNSGSFIRYPNNFGGDKREVYFEGEAYFDVKKNKNKPFIVNTGDIKIKVLGTQFNVCAYPDDDNIETTLVKGEVEVYYNNKGSLGKKYVKLKPNQKFIFQKSLLVDQKKQDQHLPTEKILEPREPVSIENIANTEHYTSWKDDKLEFSNVRFEDLITRLERWYNVSIVILNPEIKNARLSGEFEKETIEQALEALILAVPFQYKMDKNNITIYLAKI